MHLARGGYRRLRHLRKGRSLRRLLSDLKRLQQQQGARALLYRAGIEVAQALGPLPMGPSPTMSESTPPQRDMMQEHALGVAAHDLYNPSALDLHENASVVSLFSERPSSVESATWFVPHFEHVLFGGISTILRCMSWMAEEHDVKNRLVLFDNSSVTDSHLRSMIAEEFPSLAGIDLVIPPAGRAPFMNFDELPPTDIAVCTIWYSAFALLRFNATHAKFYFAQDYEPDFYPAGSLSGLAEATYRFGFAGLVNTPGLGQVYESYGNPTFSFIPAVERIDLDIPKPSAFPNRPVQLVIYARPNTPRNAFELLAATAKRVKERYGDGVRIVCAGEEWDPASFGLEGVLENLGLLTSREEVHALYLESDIGLFCMLSKHPSYQPFEYFAAGVAVVTTVNPATEWALRHRDNCLISEPYPSALSAAIVELVEDRDLRLKLARNGAEQIAGVSWANQFESMWRFITAVQTREPCGP